MANTFERTQYEQEVTEEATEKNIVTKDTVQETVEKASQEDVMEVRRPLMDKEEERKIKQDRMRFVTNKLSSTLAILAILLNVFYFVSIYKSDPTGSRFYYNVDIGISVLLNLIFMLAVFLCSEGVKNYNKSYSIALIVIGVLEFVRIFFLPLEAHRTMIGGGSDPVMSNGQFTRVVIYLAGAAALLLAAGIIGVIRSVRLANYKKTLDEKPA